jgi:riboflavin kinase/FMN adenylyltransferase
MRTLIQPDRFRDLPGPIILAAGFFDGVHAGHRAVLAGALAQARIRHGQAWALTFDQHPLSILAPAHRPPLLTPLEVRLELLSQAGLDGCLMLPFTRALAACSPDTFVDLICGGPGHIAAIHCGANWRFGQHAAGDPARLAELGEPRGFAVEIVPATLYDEHPISSTRIRRAIQHGQLSEATAMLGRPYSIRETVVRGRGIGRQLGMATANLHPAAEVLPPTGVYAVRTWLGDRPVDGVANLGLRPTFAEAPPADPVLEIHVLDFAGDLYGATLDIAFIARLRDERPFPSPQALIAQIEQDIAAARAILLHA